ncbi:hypothetical protein [Nocardia anaemiae]|uniref:hypothetical protein n=1 Tax=Nocardia anaemiae TaxID=263910 RepID=UPI0007A455A3|nr:hypothetical protein [Nocardia anaemiae]
MLIATLVIGTIGLVRRWLGRRTPETKPKVPQWRNALRRTVRSAKRPGPALAAVVTLAGIVWVGLALAPC